MSQTSGLIRESFVETACLQRLEGAIADHRAGRIEAAEAAYRLFLATSPESADAWNFLGLLLFQRGQHQAALDTMAQALSLAPEHAGVHANVGNILLHLGQHADAEVALERAVTLDPSAVEPLVALATVRKARGNLLQAEAVLRAALDVDPNHAPAHHGMANVQLARGRSERGMAHYRRALAIDPRMIHVRKLLARHLSDLGRGEEAAQEYEAYLAVHPDDPGARYLLAAYRGDRAPSRANDDYVRSTFDAFAEDFDEILDRLDYRAPQLVAAAMQQCLASPAGTLDVLDAGCGTGLLAPLIQAWCRTLVGVDLSPGMLTRARARNAYDSLVEAELTAYLGSCAPASWDLITCADTLCYFGPLDAVFTAAATALRPGGWLIFTVEQAIDADAAMECSLQVHGRYVHGRQYVDRGLMGAGFEEVRIASEPLRLNLGKPVPGLIVAARTRAAA